jgi:hypothetical protein
MAIFIACSWNSGTPSVRPSTCAARPAAVRRGGCGVGHLFLAVAAAQIGVHHVALDRAGADDGHLDDEVVELARFQARQHVHLRAAFHLEHADRIAPWHSMS